MAVDASRIRDVPLFAELTEGERSAIAEKLSERHAEAGRHLSTEGGAGYFFFVIESGTATVSHGDDVVATLGPGDFFGRSQPLHRDHAGHVTLESLDLFRRHAHLPEDRRCDRSRAHFVDANAPADELIGQGARER